MIKEDGRSFRGGLKEKGKTVFKRAALPVIQATAVIGVIVGGADMMVNPGNENEIDAQIDKRVSEAYPRTVQKEEYKLAQREIESFDEHFTRSPHKFIDRDTLSIKIPENVAQDIDLIAQENRRSKDASALKSQLKDQYSVDEAGTKRGLLIIGVSLFTFLLPDMARKGISIFRKFRGEPSSPKPANS